MCDEVSAVAPSLMGDAVNDGEKTERLMHALLERVCKHLGLQAVEQQRALGGEPGFQLLQTLEEHMQPEFSYSGTIDEHLLMKCLQ